MWLPFFVNSGRKRGEEKFLLYRMAEQIKVEMKRTMAGAGPAFLTCEFVFLESFKTPCLTGQEGWLTPALH